MLDLVILAMTAAPPVPRVITGIMSCFAEPQPEGGSQPRLIANQFISISPSQKFGIDSPKRATSIIEMSEKLYCLTADTIPAMSPKTQLKIVLQTASSRVTKNI